MKGKVTEEGDYQVVVKMTGMGGESVQDTIVVHAMNPAGIEGVNTDNAGNNGSSVISSVCYDAAGRQEATAARGLVIQRNKMSDQKMVARKIIR